MPIFHFFVKARSRRRRTVVSSNIYKMVTLKFIDYNVAMTFILIIIIIIIIIRELRYPRFPYFLYIVIMTLTTVSTTL